MEQKMQKVSNTQEHVVITTLSDNRVISLLQEALSLLNNQCEELEKASASKGDLIIELKDKLSSKIKEIETLNKEKENVCQDKKLLSEQYDQLRLEKEKIIKELESIKVLINDSNLSLCKEKDTVKQLTLSNEKLEKQIDTLNELVSQKDSEIINKNQEIEESTRANEERSREFYSLQKAKEDVDSKLTESSSKAEELSIKVKKILLYLISSIKEDIEKCLIIPSMSSEWLQYLNEIVDSINSLHSETDTKDIIEELLYADSALCKLVSILWWSCQNEMDIELSAQIPFLKEILTQTASLLNFLSLFGYNIIVPEGDYRNQIDNYALYPNSYSRINKLFPTMKFESRYKCEIYLLAYNNNTGKCYSNELK